MVVVVIVVVVVVVVTVRCDENGKDKDPETTTAMRIATPRGLIAVTVLHFRGTTSMCGSNPGASSS